MRGEVEGLAAGRKVELELWLADSIRESRLPSERDREPRGDVEHELWSSKMTEVRSSMEGTGGDGASNRAT